MSQEQCIPSSNVPLETVDDRMEMFKTGRSQPVDTALSSIARSTSIGTFEEASSLPCCLSKKIDKDLMIMQLSQRVRHLENELQTQQNTRRVEIELIKKHVTVLEKQMYFMEDENNKLSNTVQSLQQYNLQLLKLMSTRRSSQVSVGGRMELNSISEYNTCSSKICIVPQYSQQIMPLQQRTNEPQKTTETKSPKKKRKKSVSSQIKALKRKSKNENFQKLQQEIRSLDKKIRASRDKLQVVKNRRSSSQLNL